MLLISQVYLNCEAKFSDHRMPYARRKREEVNKLFFFFLLFFFSLEDLFFVFKRPNQEGAPLLDLLSDSARRLNCNRIARASSKAAFGASTLADWIAPCRLSVEICATALARRSGSPPKNGLAVGKTFISAGKRGWSAWESEVFASCCDCVVVLAVVFVPAVLYGVVVGKFNNAGRPPTAMRLSKCVASCCNASLTCSHFSRAIWK